MAEWINRDEVLSMSYCTNKPTWDNPHLEPKSVVEVEDIESLPAADVVEVVRCKNCAHWGGVTYGFVCRKFSGLETKISMHSDDFCSYGERKCEDG